MDLAAAQAYDIRKPSTRTPPTKDLAEDRNLKAYYDVDRQLLQHYSQLANIGIFFGWYPSDVLR